MSKTILISALTLVGSAGAVTMGLYTGAIDWPIGREPISPQPAAVTVSGDAPAETNAAADVNSPEDLSDPIAATATAKAEEAAPSPQPSDPAGATGLPEASASASAPEPASPSGGAAAEPGDPITEARLVPEKVSGGEGRDPERPATDAQADMDMPQFDLVRAETDGSALVAGAGRPGARLVVLVNGEPATELAIGRDGKFSAFVDLPTDGSGSVLSLRMLVDGRETLSRNDVIVAPVEMASADPADVSDAAPNSQSRAPRAPGVIGQAVGTGLDLGAGVSADAPRATDPEGTRAGRPGAPDHAARAVPLPRTGASPNAPVAQNGEPRDVLALNAPVNGGVPGVPRGQLAGLEPPATGAPPEASQTTTAPLTGLAPQSPEGGAAGAEAPEVDAAEGAPVPASQAAPAVALAGTPAATAPDPVTGPEDPPRVGEDAPDEPPAPVAGGAPGSNIATEAPVIAARAVPEPEVAPRPAAEPQVLVSGPSGVEVLKNAPLSPGEVALDAISYDAEGDVLISGRGEDDAFVRIYLDNAPVSTSQIEADGRWRVELPEVDTGTYTLRVDQIDDSGAVIARVESPFLRESAEALAAATGRGAGPITSVIVQPGNTLWGISSQRYGKGWQYVSIYKANRDRIRDPDLIYPGQIFDLPEQ